MSYQHRRIGTKESARERGVEGSEPQSIIYREREKLINNSQVKMTADTSVKPENIKIEPLKYE